MTTVHRLDTGDYLVICKGAAESVLDPHGPTRRAGSTSRRPARRAAACGCWRVATAIARHASRTRPIRPPLRPLGLVGIGDPLRPTRRATAAAFARAGVRLLLITGDHPGHRERDRRPARHPGRRATRVARGDRDR